MTSLHDDVISEARLHEMSRLPGGILGQLLPFALLATACWGLSQVWHQVPDPYIIHWNGAWQADGWTAKSWWNALIPALVGAALCALLWLVQYFVQRRALRSSDTRAEPHRRIAEIVRARAANDVLLASEILMALVGGLVTVGIPLAQTPASAKRFVFGVLLVSLVGSLGLMVWAIARLQRHLDLLRKLDALPDPASDRFWKWGVFYSNPGDTRLLVENRLGVGFTFNLARPAARLILAAIVGLPILLIVCLL